MEVSLKGLPNLAVTDKEQQCLSISTNQREADSTREFRIIEFVQAVWMLSSPLGMKALNLAAERLSISPYGLISLIAGYRSRPLSTPKYIKMPAIPQDLSF